MSLKWINSQIKSDKVPYLGVGMGKRGQGEKYTYHSKNQHYICKCGLIVPSSHRICPKCLIKKRN